MNSIDVILGIFLIIGLYSGWKQGLFVALASLVGLIAGVIGAIYFSSIVAGYLSNWFEWSVQITKLSAFAITFLAIVFLVSLAGKFLTKMADFTALGVFNKALGAIFNCLKYAFIASVVLIFLNVSDRTSDLISEEKKENSILYEPVACIGKLIVPHILREVDHYRNGDENESSPSKKE